MRRRILFPLSPEVLILIDSRGDEANHSANADPATKEIILTFDKPLTADGYSMNYGPEGKEHYPVNGTPEFLTGNASIKLPVELKPNWSYGVLLTGRAFRSPDGYPLKPYLIDFKTKQ